MTSKQSYKPPESHTEGIIDDLRPYVLARERETLRMQMELLEYEVHFWDRFMGYFCMNAE